MIDQTLSAKGWIYNLADYHQIFGIINQELPAKVLDYPAGISSVNAELYAQGKSIISADPSYHLSYEKMQKHAKKILENNISYLNKHLHILTEPNPEMAEKIIHQWETSTALFLADYSAGQSQGRYRAMELPPFSTIPEHYELLLCTDLLFSDAVRSRYSPQALMAELCRLSSEVRIFPLTDQQAVVEAELGPMMLSFQQLNFGVEVRAVNHALRRNANAMLRVWAKECEVAPPSAAIKTN